MILTTIVAFVASQLYNTLLEKGKDFLIDKGMDKVWTFLTKDKNTFITELTKVINETLSSYAELHPANNLGESIHFYESQTFMEELLKFTFIKELDIKKIQLAIESDNRIMVPTEIEINDYLNIFFDKINTNPKLKDLYIGENYQQEIFNVSQKISELGTRLENQIAELKSLVQNLVIPNLSDEWNKQLDEINEDYKSLKHKSAKSRIINLRRRMEENGLKDKAMMARTITIQADCSISFFDNSQSNDISKLHVQAYQIMPDSQDYRGKAAMAYLNLENPIKAKELAEEMLMYNQFDFTAWLVLCYTNGTPLAYIRDNIPQVLKNDKVFQLNIVYKKMSEHRFDDINILIKEGYSFLEIGEDEPERISFRNLGYWSIWCTVAIALYFSAKKEFKNSSIAEDAYDRPKLKKIQSVLKKVVDTVRDTEIENDFAYLHFQYHYICLLDNFNDIDLQYLKESYSKLKQIELNYILTFQLIRALASSKKEEDLQSAIEIIDTFPKKDIGLFLLFKINFYLDKDDKSTVAGLIKEYYTSLEEIDDLNVANMQQLFEIHYSVDKQEALFEIRKVAEEKPSRQESYKKLLLVKANITENVLDVPSVKVDIDVLVATFFDHPDYIKNYAAQYYIAISLFEDAYQFLLSYVDTEILNETTLLFCEVLYKTPTRRVILQSILANFRDKNVYLPERLIDYDLNMAKAQYDYHKVKDICLYGLQWYPNAGPLIYGLMLNLHYLKEKNEIKQNIPLLNRVDFSQDSDVAISITEVLFQNELPLEGLEFIYGLALDRANTEIGEYYVSKILTTPHLKIPETELVGLHSKVLYCVDDTNQEVEITEDNISTNEVQLLIGKKNGDEFTYTNRDLNIHTIKINAIIGKYKLLHGLILKETSNPLNGFSIKKFSVDENSDVSGAEQIIQKLIKNYGPQEEARQQQIKIAIEQYYSNELPFTILARQIFRDNLVDTYLHLTSDQAKMFRIPPSFIYDDIELSKESNFIFDLPTIVLLYQLDSEFDLKVPNGKYSISNTTSHMLKSIMAGAMASKSSIGNIQLTATGARSTFYGEGYQEGYLGFYENLMTWVDNNCLVITVPERLECIPDLSSEMTSDVYLQTLLDNLILSGREDHNLITSDMSYFKHLSGDPKSIFSVEIYLRTFLSEEQFSKARAILLKKNMVGLTLSEDTLEEEFLRRQSGGKNSYSVCLQNLAISWNGSKNVTAAITHIRWLMLNGILSNNERLMLVEETFCAMLPGIQDNHLARDLISSELAMQFKLLDEGIGNTVLYCLKNAFKYLRSGIPE